ncbi:MAG: galactose mutarotase [Chitinophagaceae bacterium]|nr:galactose mutarotase [Chitinophagaceae bacterium]
MSYSFHWLQVWRARPGLRPVVMGFILLFTACAGSGDNPRGVAIEQVSEGPVLPTASAFADTLDGEPVSLWYIRNSKGMRAALTNHGARMVGLWMPDRQGRITDIVLGFDSLSGYLHSTESFFGAVVGRYGNRIANGRFTLDGKTWQLDINNAPNSLHGGKDGFHTRAWKAEQTDSQSIRFSYTARDGEGGYPGRLTVSVIYRLTDNNELDMQYEWQSDRRTVANITNHNFWNLNGEGSGPVAGHHLQITASRYTPVDSTLIPIAIAPVQKTPFDFTSSRPIGDSLGSAHIQMLHGQGYDHNFVLDKVKADSLELAAVVMGDMSGIVMEILTTEPGIQFYGGNFMQSKNRLKSGAMDAHRSALCLETQHFPDAPNQPAFPSTIVEPGRVYRSRTLHRFRIDPAP